LFEQCYNLIKQKEHLTHAGLEKILALKYNLNKGLPDDLKSAFPKIVAVVRPEYKFNGIPDPF
jgi:predicted methyltransferase